MATFFNASGLLNTITDFIMLLIPTKAVWKLQMALKQKIGVVLIFTIGLTYILFGLKEYGRLKLTSYLLEPLFSAWLDS